MCVVIVVVHDCGAVSSRTEDGLALATGRTGSHTSDKVDVDLIPSLMEHGVPLAVAH